MVEEVLTKSAPTCNDKYAYMDQGGDLPILGVCLGHQDKTDWCDRTQVRVKIYKQLLISYECFLVKPTLYDSNCQNTTRKKGDVLEVSKTWVLLLCFAMVVVKATE